MIDREIRRPENLEKLSTWGLIKLLPGSLVMHLDNALYWIFRNSLRLFCIHVLRADPIQLDKDWALLDQLEESHPNLSAQEASDLVTRARGEITLAEQLERRGLEMRDVWVSLAFLVAASGALAWGIAYALGVI